MVAACPFPFPRGTPIRIHRMAEALARRGNEVHVVTYHLGDPIDPGPLRIHRIRDVPTYRKTSPGPTYQKLAVLDFLLSRQLERVLRDFEIEIIHAHHSEGMLVARMIGRHQRPPIVYDVHTLLEGELPYFRLGLPFRLKQWIGRRMDRALPRHADYTIAVSSEIESTLVRMQAVASDRIEVIANGVNLTPFELVPPCGERSGKPRIVIFTGNLAAYQGIDLMLRAFAQLRQQRQDVKLRIVTERSFDDYEALAQELGVRESIEVVRAGFDLVPAQLAQADIALNPRTECAGMPQKLLNYMASGKAIVSFAGSAKHVVHDVNGWVVPDGDVAAFAAATASLLDDAASCKRLGDNARRYVHEERSWNRTAASTESVYRRLLDRG